LRTVFSRNCVLTQKKLSLVCNLRPKSRCALIPVAGATNAIASEI
jgi:hypothetical protein